jgi:hypothetical protein
MAVILDISMPLDGYVTARGVRQEEPRGDGAISCTSGPSALTSGVAKSWPRACATWERVPPAAMVRPGKSRARQTAIRLSGKGMSADEHCQV